MRGKQQSPALLKVCKIFIIKHQFGLQFNLLLNQAPWVYRRILYLQMWHTAMGRDRNRRSHLPTYFSLGAVKADSSVCLLEMLNVLN